MRYIIFIFFLFNINFALADQDYHKNAKVTLKFAKYSKEEILFGVNFDLAPGWKIYDNKQYSLGFPTEISFIEKNNLNDAKVFFPKPKRFFEYDEYETFGYENQALIVIKAKAINNNEIVSAKLKINYALCNNICIAREDYINFSAKAGQLNKENHQLIQEALKSYEEGILYNVWLYLIAGVIAGFILNFMPCILPVLFLKIFNLLNAAKYNALKIRKTAFASILGIFSTFFIFSLVIILLQFLGKNIGWGLHFQQPLFVVFLMFLIVIFAASIFDHIVIDIPDFLKDKLIKFKIKDDFFLKEFFSAILAVILATPCSAPFLGTAMVFAFNGSYLNCLTIFMSIAFGFSLPYFALLIKPEILNLLPKPGIWMVKLKNIMGSFLILTIIWLTYILISQIGFLAAMIILLQIFVIFKFLKFKKSLLSFFGFKIFCFLLIVNVSLMFFIVPIFEKNNHDSIKNNMVWSNFHNINIEHEINKGNVVFINVTADWCITCKFNEFTVLNRKEIMEILANEKIIAVTADYTKKNEYIREFLESIGRYAIPTYVLFSKKNPKGKILMEVLTVELLKKELLNEIKN